MFLNNIHAVTQNTEPNSILLPDGLLYSQKILSTLSNVYAIYPLNETGVTTTAIETVNGYNGTLNGPTLNAIAGPGTSMGNAAFYDGLVDYCQLPAASLDGPFDPSAGTMMIWMKVANAGVWTDGADRYAVSIGSDVTNRIIIYKNSAANQLVWFVNAGGVSVFRVAAETTTNWLCIGITWNKSQNRIRAYLNGVQQGIDLDYTGTWSGSLADTYCEIGAIGGASNLHGYPSFLMLSSAEAAAAQMATLATAV